MSELIKTKTIGNHTISIYHDYDAECPATNWDLCGIFLWETNARYLHRLSKSCNYKDVFGKHDDGNHSLRDAIIQLITDHVKWDSMLKYFKDGNAGDSLLTYDRSLRKWVLEVKSYKYQLFDPYEIYNDNYTSEFCEELELDDLIEILYDLAPDIVVCEWSSSGYSQGDYVSGIAYCDKERYDKLCGRTDVDWKTAAEECMQSEAKCIGMWMWGDVIGYTLEKKVEYTKVYKDDNRDPEESYDWEEVDSCWGYFMEPDELINEIVEEHKLSESA